MNTVTIALLMYRLPQCESVWDRWQGDGKTRLEGLEKIAYLRRKRGLVGGNMVGRAVCES